MNVKISAVILLALSLCVSACIEHFEPEARGHQRVLVVEGHISDEAKPQRILLSRSRALDADGYIPETGAVVRVLDDEGTSYLFQEVAAGLYQSDPAVFAGVTGKRYTLEILTAGGSHYQSDVVTLRKTPPIDSVYFEKELRFTDTGEMMSGISILLDTHDDTNTTRYYQWKYEEDWEIKSPYPATYTWMDDPSGNNCGWPVLKPEFIQTCYGSDTSKSILVESSVRLAQDRISRFELNFVSTRGARLSSAYSISVNQYALEEEAYKYFVELEKLNESLGTIFDPQPYELRGNIHNTINPDEPVLGYFSASSVSAWRVFITRTSLSDLEFPSATCTDELVPVNYCLIDIYYAQGYEIVAMPPYHPANEYVIMAPSYCHDCRSFGSVEKPLFWP